MKKNTDNKNPNSKQGNVDQVTDMMGNLMTVSPLPIASTSNRHTIPPMPPLDLGGSVFTDNSQAAPETTIHISRKRVKQDERAEVGSSQNNVKRLQAEQSGQQKE